MYQAQDFNHLIGTPGFSETLLTNHFTLYQGYVKNTNLLLEMLASALKEGKTEGPAYAELKRRLGWEFNGMRLHEMYFGGMSKEKTELDPSSALAQKLTEQYGSIEQWTKDFLSAGAMRGIGWVVLYCDPQSGMLLNTWINEHDTGHLSSAIPLLIMDVFEHAYVTDYGIARAEYLKAFLNAVNWPTVAQSFDFTTKTAENAKQM